MKKKIDQCSPAVQRCFPQKGFYFLSLTASMAFFKIWIFKSKSRDSCPLSIYRFLNLIKVIKALGSTEIKRINFYFAASQRPSQRPRRKSNLRYEPRRGSDAAATRSESEEASSSSVSRQTSQVNSDRGTLLFCLDNVYIE